MTIILAILATLILALIIRQVITRAPKNGKPFLLRIAIILVILVAIGMAIRGLWPVVVSILGGLIIYGRPILQAFGLWQHWQKYRQSDQQNSPAHKGDMTAEQARDILGVDANASKQDIIVAYKRQMAKYHPDKGGSNDIASQINQAKEILLSLL